MLTVSQAIFCILLAQKISLQISYSIIFADNSIQLHFISSLQAHFTHVNCGSNFLGGQSLHLHRETTDFLTNGISASDSCINMAQTGHMHKEW